MPSRSLVTDRRRREEDRLAPSWMQAQPQLASPMTSYGAQDLNTDTYYDSQQSSGQDRSFNTPSYAQPSGTTRTGEQPPRWNIGANQPSYGANQADTRQTGTTGAPRDYQQQLQQIAGITDPTELSVAKDRLARQMFTDLQTAGHDVKWDGDQLIVDGRRYLLGTSVGQPTGGDAGQGTQAPTGPAPSGWDQEKWASGHDSPKYQIGRIAAAGDISTPEGRAAIAEQITQIPGVTQLDEDEFQMPDGAILDLYGNLESGNPTLQAHFTAPGGGSAEPGEAPTPGAVEGTGAQGAAGVTTGGAPGPGWVQTAEGGWVPPDHPLAQGAAGGAGGGAGQAQERFPTTGPSYAPGEIDQLDDFDPMAGSAVGGATEQAILDQLERGGTGDPELDRMIREAIENSLTGTDPIDEATEQAVLAILENPSSLDDKTVEMMKAANREEMAALAAQESDELRSAGFAGGFDDSRWLASEQAAGRRDRDESILASNRAIDIDAAQTRAGDRRAAASLGASYAGQRSADQRADIGLAASYDQQKAGQSQAAIAAGQSFAALQSDNAFRTAAAQGDRMALRESVNQKAAELGMSADALQLDYTIALLDDATRRHGINVGASIDREKLRQAGREFQEDLAFSYAQLDQLDAQFGASLGLDTARLEIDANASARDSQQRAYGV